MRRLVFDQRFQVQPVLDFRWSSLSVTEKDKVRIDRRTEILVSNIGGRLVPPISPFVGYLVF